MFTKTITLDPQDLETIERVLSVISDATASVEPARGDYSSADLVRFGRLVLALRRQRSDFFHPAMLGEPAYDMLLALYTADDERKGLTLARLSELSQVPQSSGLRWFDYLSSKKLVERSAHPTDKRASLIILTDQGRAMLDGLFSNMLNEVTQFT